MVPISNRANHFELTDGQVTIVYDETSFTGQPQVRYREGPNEEARTFQGNEVRIQNSELGSQVTVTLENVPDSESISLTLIVPEVHLRDVANFRFETIAIETTVRQSFAGPRGVQGAVQSYSVLDLEGSALFVIS
jgi:hypothetical protein